MIYHATGVGLPTMIERAAYLVRKGCVPAPQSMWQAVDVSKRPDMKLWEIENVVLHSSTLPATAAELAAQVPANLPWAEDHFQERMSGHPLNPGEQYKNWPHWHGQDEAMKDGDKFSHTYMERYWPRFAGGKSPGHGATNRGIRYRYGDLHDVIGLLLRDPHTRQAYLPIFFPEDTGAHHGQRVPCTLGYHFKRTPDGHLNVYYPIRSCDYFRHFHDDIYLTVRLAQWLLDQLKFFADGPDGAWDNVKLGSFTMHIYSLHYFEGDRYIHREFFDATA